MNLTEFEIKIHDNQKSADRVEKLYESLEK